jgi:hypothetical protein
LGLEILLFNRFLILNLTTNTIKREFQKLLAHNIKMHCSRAAGQKSSDQKLSLGAGQIIMAQHHSSLFFVLFCFEIYKDRLTILKSNKLKKQYQIIIIQFKSNQKIKMIFTRFNLTFLSILPFVVKGGGLRRRTLTQETCTPVPNSNQQSVFVLLELNGSEKSTVADKNDTAALNDTFVYAYHYVSLCSQEGAKRAVDEAIVINTATELNEPSNFQYDFPRGNFTWLVEVDMKCNSCSNDNNILQLFDNTEVGLTNYIETLNKPPNECACGGPSQTDFLALFQTLFDQGKLEDRSSNVQILNATQIPLLSRDECGIQPDTTITFYNYTGVCLSKTFRQFNGFLTEPPSMSPTDFPTDSPTNSPTNSPTDSPTNSPTNSPTDSPTDSPTNSPTDSPTNEPTNEPTKSPTEKPSCDENQLGCGRDEYGCIPSAGYFWCELTQQCTRPYETPCERPAPTSAPTDMPILSGVPEPTDAPTDMPILSGVPEPTDAPTYMPTSSDADSSSAPGVSRRAEAESNTSDGATTFSSSTNYIVI